MCALLSCASSRGALQVEAIGAGKAELAICDLKMGEVLVQLCLELRHGQPATALRELFTRQALSPLLFRFCRAAERYS